MPLRPSSLGFLNLVFSLGIFAVGFSSSLAAIRRLPVEVTVNALRFGQPVAAGDVAYSTDLLSAAAQSSNAARNDLAITLIANVPGNSFELMTAHGRIAKDQLRIYLSHAPADSIAWGNLAVAELKSGDIAASVNPLKMSMLLAASSGSLIWRCGFGLTVYSLLDAEGIKLLTGQFRYAIEGSPKEFIQLIRQRNAIPIARALLADNSISRENFEKDLLLFP